MEVIVFFLGALFFLFMLCAFGHFVWVGVASIFSGVNTKRCPECQLRIDQEDKACKRCGWTSKTIGRAQAMVICRQALDSALNRKVIDEETHQRGADLLAALDASFTAAVEPPPVAVEPPPLAAIRTVPLNIPARRVARPSTNSPTSNNVEAEVVEASLVTPVQEDGRDQAIVVATAVPEQSSPARENAQGHIHALDRDYSESTRSTRSSPRAELKRNWGKWLNSFMEEKNIQWGELAGGLLIVCCSIALVISFWGQIAARPWLKFSIFTGVNAATLLLGLNTWHRWRLPTTSRGILLIGVLLVPLNFLAFAVFTLGMPWDWWTVAGELVSLAVLSVLVWYATKVITPFAPIEASVAAVGFAVANLLIRRFVGHDSNSVTLYAVGIPILAMYGFTSLLALRRSTWRTTVWGATNGNGLNAIGSPVSENSVSGNTGASHGTAGEALRLLSIPTVGFTIAFGLLLFCTGTARYTLHLLSPVLLTAAVPMAVYAINLGMRETMRSRLQLLAMGMGAASITIAVFATVMALPNPVLLFISMVLLATMLTFVSVAMRTPAYRYSLYAIGGILFWLAVQCVSSALPVANEDWRVIWSAVNSTETGFSFVFWSLLCGGISFVLSRLRYTDDAQIALRSAGLFAAAGTVVLTVYGFGRPQYATSVSLVYLTYALSLAVVGHLRRKAIIDNCAAVFAFGACSQSICFGSLGITSNSVATYWTMLAAAIVTVVMASVRWFMARNEVRAEAQARPLELWSALFAGIAGAVAVYRVFAHEIMLHANTQLVVSAWGIVLLALVWLAITVIVRRQECTWVTQGFVWLAGVLAIVHRLRKESWAADLEDVWLHPNNLFALCLWTVMLGALVSLLFYFAQRNNDWFKRHASLCSTVVLDNLMSLAVVVFILLGCYSVYPGAMQELLPFDAAGEKTTVSYVFHNISLERHVASVDQFGFNEIPWRAIAWHGDPGAIQFVGLPIVFWIWLGVCASLVVYCFVKYTVTSVALTTAAVASIAFPVAAGWQSDIAVASALRWTTSVTFVVLCSALFGWFISRFSYAYQLPDELREQRMKNVREAFDSIISVLIALVLIPYVLMVSIVGLGAIPSLLYSDAAMTVRVGAIVSCFVGFGVISMGVLYGRTVRNVASRAISLFSLGVVCVIAGSSWLMLEIVMILVDHPLTGPNPNCIFMGAGLATSYTIPVLLFSVGLMVASAVRRSPAIAFSSNIVLLTAGMAGYFLTIKSLGAKPEAWVGLLSVLTCLAAVFALVWKLHSDWAERWLSRRFENRVDDGTSKARAFWLETSRTLATTFFVAGMSLDVWIFWWNEGADLGLRFAALAMFVAAIALGGMRYMAYKVFPSHASLLTTGILIGTIAASFITDTWLSLLILCVCLCVVACVSIAISWRDKDEEVHPRTVAASLLLASFMAIRVIGIFHAELTLPFSILGVVAAIAFVVFLRWDRRGFAIGSMLAAQVGGLLFSAYLIERSGGEMSVACPVFIEIGLIAIYGSGFAFSRLSMIGRILSWLSLCLLALVCGVWYLNSLVRPVGAFPLYPLVGAWCCCVTCVLVRRCKGASRHAFTQLYMLGLIGTTIFFHVLRTDSNTLVWTSTLIFGAYSLAYGTLWRIGDRVTASVGVRRWLPESALVPSTQDAAGVVYWNVATAVLVSMLGIVAQFDCPILPIRFASSLAVLAVAFSVGMLARYREVNGSLNTSAEFNESPGLRVTALLIGALSALAFSWHVGPPETLLVLDRVALAILAMAVVAAGYAFGLIKLLKLTDEWSKAALFVMPFLVFVVGALTLFAMTVEGGWVVFNDSGRISTLATVCIASGIILSMITSIAAAVLPGKDPFGLSERGRTSYVYVCELLLLLLVVHLRFAMPWLFAGWLQSVWPLLIVALSMFGLVVSEFAKRRRFMVIAEPLERTGSLLPMLPLLGHWAFPSQIDYGVSLVCASVAFASYSYTKKSMLFWGASVLAANGALWYTFHNYKLDFWTNPQLWVIPPALCLLAVVQILRKRLPRIHVASARYIATSSIYVSSTAEIFIHGISEAPWLPVVLAALSIAGILVGIAVRIRALLWLGMMFLGVALFSIVWHAAVDLQQTWVWYVSGIVMGAMMLIMFGLFEKRREDLKGLIHTLQTWDD